MLNDIVKRQIVMEENFQESMEIIVEPFVKQVEMNGCFTNSYGHIVNYYSYINEEAHANIVISHGFCEFVDKYYELIYILYNMGYSIYMLEHIGHGYSERLIEDLDKVHIEDFNEYVESLKEFTENIVINDMPKYLYSHSMGGAIAAMTVEKYPKLFDKLILSSPMLGINGRKYPDWLPKVISCVVSKTQRKQKYNKGQHGFDDEYVFNSSSCLSEARYKYVFNKRKENKYYRTYGGTYKWLNESYKGINYIFKTKNIANIDIPILLFKAEEDTMVRNKSIDEFVEKSNCELVNILGTKHEIFNGSKKARFSFYEEIDKFFQ